MVSNYDKSLKICIILKKCLLPSSVLVCSSLPVELELALLSQVTILDRSFLRDRVKFGIIGDEGRGSVGGVKPLDKLYT